VASSTAGDCAAEGRCARFHIQDAERRHHDETEILAAWVAGLPASRLDYDWFATVSAAGES